MTNVTLTDARIRGHLEIGGIAGEINVGSAVSNCFVKSGVYVEGYTEVGGIVGRNYESSITNCHVMDGGYIHGISWIDIFNDYRTDVHLLGGIVGYCKGTVSNCTSAAQFTFDNDVTELESVGGIAGFNDGTLSNCLAIGTNIPSLTTTQYIGAIVGEYYGTLDHNYYVNCTVGGATSNIGYGYQDGSTWLTSDLTENDGAVPGLALYDSGTDASGNATTIADNADTGKNVALYGRTLFKDGDWNTLCLPFGVSDFTGTAFEDATVMELDTYGDYSGNMTGYDDATGTLYLYFKDATAIEAGKPYIVKWATPADDIFSPVFSSVSLTAAAPAPVTSQDSKVSFVGSYSPVALTAGDKSTLYLGSNNTLRNPKTDVTIGSCRAYFTVNDGSEVKDFVLSFGGDDPTGIKTTDNGLQTTDIYNLAGQRLNKMQKGINIVNGKKILK